MSLLLKAQALQQKRMEALRKYVADLGNIDNQRHELDLAAARAWTKIVRAGWTPGDLTQLGLRAPKRPRVNQSTADPEVSPSASSQSWEQGQSDG